MLTCSGSLSQRANDSSPPSLPSNSTSEAVSVAVAVQPSSPSSQEERLDLAVPSGVPTVPPRAPTDRGLYGAIETPDAKIKSYIIATGLLEVQEGEPGNKVSMDQLFKGKKGVLFAVPGAFTPGCSKTHLPGFVEQAADLKSKGMQEVACISVNDAFVMAAWGKEHGADGKAVDLLLDSDQIVQALGNKRSKRYAMVVEDGVVKKNQCGARADTWADLQLRLLDVAV
ncbi:peroxiredoxin-5, mitochondrial [Notothenia coriiceps]|uniref:Peroxiredoxin-5 n=1 Tax=Notothenia coriiceps TaxID=8208 RepID=A0A6I9P0S2_9TELE|nr:PREDICTED: peroxiredoxin-5, mitochondrial [Notothenia coriiceps]